MKKSISVILSVMLIMSLFVFAGISASADTTKTYYIPLREDPPVLDGKGDDAAWNGAYTVNMSIEALKSYGFVEFISKSDGATGTIKMVWSNKSGREGLYFLCTVNDPTNGWAIDVLAPGPQYEQLSDGFQVFIDPMYARDNTYKKTAMRFNFVPYRCQSGNGMCPTQPAGWWESWQWQSNYAPSGVEVSATLDSTPDSYRELIVKAYTIEAFLPWKSLNVNWEQPQGVVGEKMGIGLALRDIDWDKEAYDEACKVEYNPIPSIIKVNYMADFKLGERNKDATLYPKYYNTLILANADGSVPEDGGGGGGNQGGGETGGGETETTVDQDKAAAMEALIAMISSTKSDYLESDEAKDKFTEESISALSEAVSSAEAITDVNTIDEINSAKSAIETAITQLVEKPKENNNTGNSENEPDKQPEDESSSLPIGAIIGIVAGVVVLAAAVIIIIVVLKKKKSAISSEPGESSSDNQDLPGADNE